MSISHRATTRLGNSSTSFQQLHVYRCGFRQPYLSSTAHMLLVFMDSIRDRCLHITASKHHFER